MDCVLTVNYLTERARMTNRRNIDCSNCPLSKTNNGMGCGCDTLEREHSARAVEIVQRWSDRNQAITFKADFKKQFPDCNPIKFKGCLKYYYGEDCISNDVCDDLDCSECWEQSIPQDILNKLKEVRKNGKD